MSRSFKHTPSLTSKGHKEDKRLANKRVRKLEELDGGRAFRKVSQSYEIKDQKWLLEKHGKRSNYMNEKYKPDENLIRKAFTK